VAPGRNDGKRGFSGLRDEAQEVVTLIVDYIKQETLDPVKGLGRYVVFGVVGSVALSIGLFVLAVGFLRLLQTETGSTFTGNLSWIPYVICAVLVVLIAFIAVKAVSRGQTPDPSSDKPTPTPAGPKPTPAGPAAPQRPPATPAVADHRPEPTPADPAGRPDPASDKEQA